jgi:hypothetical protein
VEGKKAKVARKGKMKENKVTKKGRQTEKTK